MKCSRCLPRAVAFCAGLGAAAALSALRGPAAAQAPPARAAQSRRAGTAQSSTAGNPDRHYQRASSQIQSACHRFERLRISAGNKAEAVAKLVAATAAAITDADGKIGAELADLADAARAKRLTAPQLRQAEARKRHLRILRCHLALSLGRLYLRAGAAAGPKTSGGASYLRKAIDLLGKFRVEYLDLPLGMMGYMAEAHARRLAGQLKDAHTALAPIMRLAEEQARMHPKDPRRAVISELLLAARIETLEIHALANPALAITQGLKLRGSPELEGKPSLQGTVDWILARSYLARAGALAAAADGGAKPAEAVRAAADLLRSKSVRGVAPQYDRLEAILQLDGVSGGKTVTREELLAWADLRLATGRPGVAGLYTRAAGMPGPPLSVERLLRYAALLWRQKDYARVAATCEELLERIKSDHERAGTLLRMRLAALMKVQAGLKPEAPGRDRRRARIVSSLEDIVESSLPAATRRDALRRWVSMRAAGGSLADCLKMVGPDRHDDLVAGDAYLLYARAGGRWQEFSAAARAGKTPGDAKKTCQAIAAALAEARSEAAKSGNTAIEARSALLGARILAGPVMKDSLGALTILNSARTVLAAEKATSAAAGALRLQLSLELGHADAAAEALRDIQQRGHEGRAEAVIKLAEIFSQRYAGAASGKGNIQKKVLEFCGKAMSGAVGGPKTYVAIARRAARTMLAVEAWADAERTLRNLLRSAPVKADKATHLDCSLMLADAMLGGKKQAEAVTYFRQLSRRYPESAEVFLATGRCELLMRDPKKAADAFRNARKLSPRGGEAWGRATLGLADALAREGHVRDAADVLRVAAVLYPDFGNVELRAELVKMREEYDAALKSGPDNRKQQE